VFGKNRGKRRFKISPLSIYRFVQGYLNFFFSWRGLPVRRHDLVIDVGSGDNPNIRADVLCDLYPQSNRERSGKQEIWLDERPFIVCDIQKLPFQNKVFDYVICSHLLEHVEDPEQAAKELTRIGKRGRVETPGDLFETLYGWPFHRWKVSRGGDGRVIFERKDPLKQGLLPEVIRKSREFEKLVARFSHEFLVRFEWQDSFFVEVRGKEMSARGQASLNPARFTPEMTKRRTLRQRAKALLIQSIRLFISRHTRMSLSEILCCPACRGPLQDRRDGFFCQSCDRLFPGKNGVFFFVEEMKTFSGTLP